MKASTNHQTAQEALMVMREAFRDQAGVGINPAGELVYVNPQRQGKASVDISTPEEIRNVLAAKLENDLARSHTSIEQLRLHIKKKLPSLSEVNFKADNPAIPMLLCEWEELLRQTDPVRCAEFQKDTRVMARREKLVDLLRSSLPANGDLTPLGDNEYEATISAARDQQKQMLETFEVNPCRTIDASLNITAQLVKDSRRSNDLQILMPSREKIKREVIHLTHAPANQTAAALQELTRVRHGRQSATAENTPHDQLEIADKNFMQVISMMVDQTLLNHLDTLQAEMLGDQKIIFNRDDDQRHRQLHLDQNGNLILTISEQKLSKSFVAADVSLLPLPLKSPPRGTPISSENATFSFRAGVKINRSDAEQGILRAQFIDTPELAIRFSLDWKSIDPILAKTWP